MVLEWAKYRPRTTGQLLYHIVLKDEYGRRTSHGVLFYVYNMWMSSDMYGDQPRASKLVAWETAHRSLPPSLRAMPSHSSSTAENSLFAHFEVGNGGRILFLRRETMVSGFCWSGHRSQCTSAETLRIGLKLHHRSVFSNSSRLPRVSIYQDSVSNKRWPAEISIGEATNDVLYQKTMRIKLFIEKETSLGKERLE